MRANQSYSTVLYMDGMNIYSTTNKGEKKERGICKRDSLYSYIYIVLSPFSVCKQ